MRVSSDNGVVFVNNFLNRLPKELICSGGEGTHGLICKGDDGKINVLLGSWGPELSLPLAKQAVQLLSEAGLPAKIFGKE